MFSEFTDCMLERMRDREAVNSYPVVWQVADTGEPVVAGRLEIGERTLTFQGGVRGAERLLAVPLADVLSVRGDYAWLGPLRGIAVDATNVGRIVVATTAGLLVRSEILEALRLATAAAVA